MKSELKYLSDEKTTSEKGLNSASNGKVSNNEFERDTEEDSYKSAKAPQKKTTKHGVLHYI